MAALDGSKDYYLWIVAVIAVAFVLIVGSLLGVYSLAGSEWLAKAFGFKGLFLIQLYFWGALGATIACARYCANDQEKNEVEALKNAPDPNNLRYPNFIDVCFYFFRVVFSGALGVVGSIILLATLGYFDVATDKITTKTTLFFIVVSFVVGMHQNEFLTALGRVNKSVVAKMKMGPEKE